MPKAKPPVNQTPGVFTDTIRGTSIELNYKDLTEDVYNVLRGRLDGRRNTSGNGAELKDAGFLSVFEGDLGKGYVSLTTNAHYQSDIIQKIVAGLNEYLVKRYGEYAKDGTLTNAANIPAFTVARPNLRTISAAMDNHAEARVNKSLVKMPVARDYRDGVYTAMYRTKTGNRGKALDQDVYERVSDAVLEQDERIAVRQEQQHGTFQKRIEAGNRKDTKEAEKKRKDAEKVFSDANKEIRRAQNAHKRELRKIYRPGITMLAGDVAEGMNSFENVADYLDTVPEVVREEMRELFNRTFASRKHTKDKAQWKKENDPSKRQKAMITMLAGDVAEGLKTRGNVEDYFESLPENVQGEMRELFEKKYDVLKGKRDRLIRANIRAEERDPANPRFYTHIGEGLDRQEARYRARVAWAKQNPKTRLGKQILKADRAVRFRGAKGKALLIASLITAAIGVLGKIWGSVVGVASDVRKMASKGASVDVTAGTLLGFESLEKRLGLKEGTTAEYLGSLQSTLFDPATGGNFNGTYKTLAPLLSKAPNGMELNRRMALYAVGQDTDTNGLGQDLLNAYLTTSLQGHTLYGDMSAEDALRFNAESFSRIFGMKDFYYNIARVLQDPGVITSDMKARIISVGSGTDSIINGQRVRGYDTLGALVAAVKGTKEVVGTEETATPGNQKNAEGTAQSLAGLEATFKEIKTGILTDILSSLRGIASFVEEIVKFVLTKIPGHAYDDVIRGMDEKAYQYNLEQRDVVQDNVTTLEKSVLRFGQDLGITSKEAAEKAAKKYYYFEEGIPSEFAGVRDKYVRFMELIQTWVEARNDLAELNARITGYNSTEEQPYEVLDNYLPTKKGYKYKLGNMRRLETANIYDETARSRRKTLSAMDKSINILDTMADMSRDERLSYIRDMQDTIFPDPTDTNRLINAVSLAAAMDIDRQAFGSALEPGQSDKLRQGEIGYLNARDTRNIQSELAQVFNAVEQVRSQAGIMAAMQLIEGKVQIEVSGNISGGEKTYNIVLKNTAGEEIGRVQDVENIGNVPVNNALFEAWLWHCERQR